MEGFLGFVLGMGTNVRQFVASVRQVPHSACQVDRIIIKETQVDTNDPEYMPANVLQCLASAMLSINPLLAVQGGPRLLADHDDATRLTRQNISLQNI
jgi:hypothetical protein